MKRLLRISPVLLGCALSAVYANPTGPTVVNGNALVTNPSAGVLQVVNTPGTIINWQSFSIGSGQTTRFVQSGAASAVLNRDIGGARSDILGRLESNGRVFLVNPNGILFGGSSVVDVAGLIASTRDISNVNFAAGNYRFDGPSLGSITVQAGSTITTASYSASGGQVWLIAPRVTQEAGSTIAAPQGQVVLAAGSQVVVGESGLGQMTFSVSTSGGETVDSLGAIAADRGAVGLFADVVNHRGTITAPNGSVDVHGGTRVEIPPTATINADGAAGRITVRSNDIRVYPVGNVHAVGGTSTFEQYQPSQFTAGPIQTLLSFSNTTTSNFAPVVVFRRPDGNFTLRYSHYGMTGTLTMQEVILDAAGLIVSGPVAIPGATESAVVPAAPYFGHLGILSPLLLPTAVGTSVDRKPGSFTVLRFFSSSGTEVGQATIPNVWVSYAPLADGTVGALGVAAFTDTTLSVYRFQPNGAAVDSFLVGPRSPNLQEIMYPTEAGGFTLIGRTLHPIFGHALALASQPWNKSVAAYNPSGALVVGEAGIAATFATRPGAIPGSVPAAAPPPPPPPANPGGVSFGGVSGCNASVCSDEVRAAIAVTNAVVAVGSFSSGPIGQQQAADAVAKLELAASLSASTGAAPATPGPAALPAPGASSGSGVLISDGGQLERLQQEALKALKTEPGNANEIIAHYEAAVKTWAEREALTQSLGMDSGDRNDMTIVDAIMNMTPKERTDFFQGIANEQLRGTD